MPPRCELLITASTIISCVHVGWNPPIRAYDQKYFGRSAEDRLGELARRAKIGPAEGESGVTRVESFTSNGVQVWIDSLEWWVWCNIKDIHINTVKLTWKYCHHILSGVAGYYVIIQVVLYGAHLLLMLTVPVCTHCVCHFPGVNTGILVCSVYCVYLQYWLLTLFGEMQSCGGFPVLIRALFASLWE